MKQIWKRSMSLLLSGVLLLNNVPLSALATEESPAPTETVVEEVQPVETEPVQTQPVETQPVVTVLENSAEVANDGDNIPTPGYPVYVNALQLNESNAANVTDNSVKNGKVSYAGGVLYLKGAEIKADAPNVAIKTTDSLTIHLEGENVIDGGAAIAIEAAKDLTITGDGSLVVKTANPTAILVAGVSANEGNEKKGLTINGAQVSVETTHQKTQTDTRDPVGIDSANGVTIAGGAHVKTNHSKANDVYTLPDGYQKIGEGKFEKTTSSWTSTDGSAFEFVSDMHLTYALTGENDAQHMLRCSDSCKLTKVVPLTAAHSTGAEGDRSATCAAYAYCSVCGKEYGAKEQHDGNLTWVPDPENENLHIRKYSGCGCVTGEAASHSRNQSLQLSGNGDALVYPCGDCQAQVTYAKIYAPAADTLVWNSEPKAATAEPAQTTSILYYKDAIPADGSGGSTEAPEEPGTYVAQLTVDGETQKPWVTFTISKKPLSMSMVNGIDANGVLPFDDSATETAGPVITLTDKERNQNLGENDFSVTANRGANADKPVGKYTDPGTITFKIEAKTESQYYANPAKPIIITYTIPKAEPNADMFAFTAPNVPQGTVLAYDGREKNANIGINGGYAEAGLGEITEIKWYKDGEVTQKPFIDAGVYTVKISVAEGENYEEKNDLTDDDWTFTITPADVTPPEALNTVYTDITEDRQLIAAGLNRFEGPRITGYTRTGADAPDQITGTVTYTYDDNTTEDIDAVNRYLNGLPDDTTVTVGYELVPNVPNYTGKTKKQEVSLTRTTLVVKLNNVAASKDEILQAIKAQAPKYGDKIVDTSKLSVHKGDAAEAIPGTFTVKYSKSENGVYGEQLELEKPGAGSYKFYVYFNSTSRSVGAISDLLVAEGDVIIGKKTPSVTVKPNAERKFVYNGQDQNLEVVTTDGGTLKYRIHGQTEWKNTLTLKDAAVYWVYYKVVGDNNHNSLPESVERKITVTILPKLESTFGNKLNSVALPAGWTWHVDSETLADVLVGSAGEYEEYQYTLDYNADKDSATNPTGSQVSVPMKILRKEVKIQVTLPETHYKLVKKSATVIGLEKTITPVVKYYKTATELEALPSAEYNVSRSLTDYPGHGEVTVTSKNVNYDFSEDSDLSESYIVYRPGAYSLSIVPDTLKSTYDDVSELKEALHNGLAKKHADTDVTYYNVKMQEYDETVATNWRASDEELYCPENGFTFTLPYPTGEDENTEFELVGINTMNNASNRSVAKISFALKSGGIEFQMKNYAAVCLAWDGYNETDTYKVDTATSSYGTVKFTVGSDTTKKTSDDAVKVEEKINVFAEPNTNYAVTKVQYTYKDGSTTKAATIKQDDSGNYTFKMPAKDITIKVTFSKKTTSTKNPYSGDTSNIYLWLAILASSAVGIVALVIFWFKKRRK